MDENSIHPEYEKQREAAESKEKRSNAKLTIQHYNSK